MLSQKNIDKLHMNGLYTCDPVLEWLPSYRRDTPYWCKNWTFRVRKSKSGKYYMHDTYWSTGDEHPVELTDDNFDNFKFLFDFDDIQYINSYEDYIEYPKEDRWNVAINSGGKGYPKYVVRKGAKKVKQRVIDRLENHINYLKHELELSERSLEKVINDEIDLDRV